MRYPESESNILEFKEEIPRNDQIIKTMIGFCNLHGGKLVIGVSDDRNIKGLSEDDIEKSMEFVLNTVYDACIPPIIPRLYVQRFGDSAVLVIEVCEGMDKPYYRRSEGIEKGVYLRLGRHTMRATTDMIQELKWQSTGVNFECLPVYQATIDDLDQLEIKKFLDNRKNQGVVDLDEQVMKSYNIIAYHQAKKYPSVLGILLFGRKPQLYISEAMIICSHFQGVSGREVIATIDCEGTLFSQFKQAFAFITARLYRSFSIKTLKRDEKLEIPEEAIREALLNAIVHRNYYIKAPTKIAIYDDRVEFFSPGQFPGPLRIDNLKAGITYLRNPIMCKILREANYIEKLGSGFITIFSSYHERNLKTPQVIEGENYIKCILPREMQEAHTPKTDIQKILELFVINNEINIKDVVLKLSVSRPTAVRKLNSMIEQGLIERIGHSKSTYYCLVKK